MVSTFAVYPSLRDRGVLITGGASGIGAGMVEHFAEQGACVGFVDLDGAAAQRRSGSGGEKASTVRVVAADLRDIAQLRDAIARLRAELGRPIRVLVNNA